MTGFTYESQGQDTLLVYHLQKWEHLDSFARGMVQGNKISGILPLSFVQNERDQYLEYFVTSKIPLRNYLKKEMERLTVLKLCSSIVRVLMELEEFRLSRERLLLDIDFIFMDTAKREVGLVYLPVEEFQSGQPAEEFLLWLLSHMQFRLDQDVAYVAKIIHYINQPEGCSFRKLLAYLADLTEGDIRETGAACQRPGETGRESRSFWQAERGMRPEPARWPQTGGMRPDNPPAMSLEPASTIYTGEFLPQVPSETELCEENCDATVTLEEEYKDNIGQGRRVGKLIRRRNGQSALIQKEVFHIGRGGNFVDFQIADNRAIGTSHADILLIQGQYYIRDRNSLNHTYVNGAMVAAGQERPIYGGDVITLANEDFDFIIS